MENIKCKNCNQEVHCEMITDYINKPCPCCGRILMTYSDYERQKRRSMNIGAGADAKAKRFFKLINRKYFNFA